MRTVEMDSETRAVNVAGKVDREAGRKALGG